MTMNYNVVADVMARVRKLLDGQWFRGEVTGTDGNKVLVRRNGNLSEDPIAYPRFAHYSSPQVGDSVLVRKVGKQWIVEGEVVS